MNISVVGLLTEDINILLEHNYRDTETVGIDLSVPNIHYCKEESGCKLLHDLIKELDGRKSILSLCNEQAHRLKTYYIWHAKPEQSVNYRVHSYLGSEDCNPSKGGFPDELDDLGKADIMAYYEKECTSLGKRVVNELADREPLVTVYRALSPTEKTEATPIVKFINAKERSAWREKALLVIKLEDLKKLGADIHACNTWEELLRNTGRELTCLMNSEKFPLIRSRYVIVDFDYDGCALFQFESKKKVAEIRKHIKGFDSKATREIEKYLEDTDGVEIAKAYIAFNRRHIKGSGYREVTKNHKTPSSLIAAQAIVVSCLAKYIESNPQTDLEEHIERTLVSCFLTNYHLGNQERKYTEKEEEPFPFPKKKIGTFVRNIEKYMAKKYKRLPSGDLSFLKEHFPGYLALDSAFFAENSQKDFLSVANGSLTFNDTMYNDIVLEGLRTTEGFLRDVPYVEFENLVSIEHDEVKGYRIVMEQITGYLKSNRKTPLSICVFGAPGSGKSFGITQILKHINKIEHIDEKSEEHLVFNLSQMKTVEELHNAFHAVSSRGVGGGVSVVFWDEFDSNCEGADYGWLKHFLAPMQDGSYYHNNVTHRIGRSIFVFAGSKAETWGEFLDRVGVKKAFSTGAGKGKEGSEDDAEAESLRSIEKGVDFISRVAAYMDIKGPDRVNSPDRIDKGEEEKCRLRRAILLNGFFKKHMKENSEPLKIDPSLLDALLYVDHYQHGRRSLDKLVEQLVENSNGSSHVQLSSIPAQLDVYCDEKSFRQRIKNKSSDLIPD
jgi:hypothetical protein